ncbi:MAG: glycosyltransferase [Alphaproteobacteria bacterium]|nr:glycosyltransferase [Alphaproteobacteria bacterium]
MKILQIMAGGAHGGAETAFIDTCLALQEAGEEIIVATRRNPRNERLNKAGIPVFVLPFGGGMDVYTPWRLTRIIRKTRPDLVQSWMGRAAAKIPADHAGVPVLSRLGNQYKMKNFARSDYFLAITPMIRDYLIANGIAPERVRHINNFAETELDPIPLNRANFDTPERAPLLIALGRLHEAKAFDTLLKALAKVPEAYLWIAGEGPDRGILESLRNELDLKDRVRFLGWRNDRAALLKTADLCVFPSREEAFGTVFVQAWAQRTPLIASMADGPRQFVRDGEDGILFPIDDVDSLAQAIRTALDNPSLRENLVENGYRRYEREFTKAACVKVYQEYYHDIVQGRCSKT